MLDEVVENISSEVSKVVELLQGDSQAMWAILNSSLAHKLDWHLTFATQVTLGRQPQSWTANFGQCLRRSRDVVSPGLLTNISKQPTLLIVC